MGVGWKNVRSLSSYLPQLTRSLTTYVRIDWDLVFADDEREANPGSFKFFQAAQEWSRKRAGAPDGAGAGAGGAGRFADVLAGMESGSESDEDSDDDDEQEEDEE